MEYIQAQKIAIELQSKNDPAAWDAFWMLEQSWDASKSTKSSKWEPCQMPDLSEFDWWVKGIPTSSYPSGDGSWRTWSFRQPKAENFVYLITKTRRPVPASETGEWETIVEVARKPLYLTNPAQSFFANFKNIIA